MSIMDKNIQISEEKDDGFDLYNYQQSIGFKRAKMQKQFCKKCANADLLRDIFDRDYYLNACNCEQHRLRAKFPRQCNAVDDEENGFHYLSLAIDADYEMDLANIEYVYNL
jgi:hypothetical protein